MEFRKSTSGKNWTLSKTAGFGNDIMNGVSPAIDRSSFYAPSVWFV